MESNKDEALKCLSIARQLIENGNYDKANRFVNKSIKLYPTDQATTLLQKLANIDNEAKASSSQPSKHKSSENQSAPDFSNLHGSSVNNEEEKKYTEDQLSLVRKINSQTDYYKILGCEKSASESDLKKAYRKMALQLHPDKNQAPGATDAFKSVGKAFSCLSNAESRERYDMYGPEDASSQSTTRRRRRRHSNEYFEDGEFDPQELFNMFFGGGFPQNNVRVFRRGNTYYYGNGNRNNQSARRQHEQASNFGAFIQFLPLIMVFILSLLGNLLSSPPNYSLYRHGEYQIPRHTENYGAKYYVKSSFSNEFKQGTVGLKKVENEVERDWVDNLRNSCYDERQRKEQTYRIGQYHANKAMMEKANRMNTPSCETLEKIFTRAAKVM